VGQAGEEMMNSEPEPSASPAERKKKRVKEERKETAGQCLLRVFPNVLVLKPAVSAWF
jgi:hypothetical protein